jgi:hypothetical protein
VAPPAVGQVLRNTVTDEPDVQRAQAFRAPAPLAHWSH